MKFEIPNLIQDCTAGLQSLRGLIQHPPLALFRVKNTPNCARQNLARKIYSFISTKNYFFYVLPQWCHNKDQNFWTL